MSFSLIAIVIVMILLVTLRIYFILPKRKSNVDIPQSTLMSSGNHNSDSTTVTGKKYDKVVEVLVVLGSGGHTTEMIEVLRVLSPKLYRFHFVSAASDESSFKLLQQKLSNNTNNGTKPSDNEGSSTVKTDISRVAEGGSLLLASATYHKITRSRSVHQSYITSIFTTLYSIFYSIFLTYPSISPDLVLCNGPGTCIPLVFAVYFYKFFNLMMKTKVIFIESVARVQHLSLTGLILYHTGMTDRFFVQWPQLLDILNLNHRKNYVEYIGRVL